MSKNYAALLDKPAVAPVRMKKTAVEDSHTAARDSRIVRLAWVFPGQQKALASPVLTVRRNRPADAVRYVQ
jgi:hypothetical protein